MSSQVNRRWLKFRKALQQLIVGEDAFGLVTNEDQRWRFRTSDQKVEEFRNWIEEQLKADILGDDKTTKDDWWATYVQQSYEKGTGRAFDDTKKNIPRDDQGRVSDFYRGTKDAFLRSAFARPESVEKIKLLAGRVLTDLKGVTGYMAQQMIRELTDGLAQGENPRTIARRLVKALDISKNRALTIARTEIVRAHAEGQLDGLERLGVEKVGVMVEWVTVGDSRVCPLCQPLAGTVLRISEARGMLPRHPNCRCAWAPANVGEDKAQQKRGRTAIEQALKQSVSAETGKRGEATSKWVGADLTPTEKRPESVLDKSTSRSAKTLSVKGVEKAITKSGLARTVELDGLTSAEARAVYTALKKSMKGSWPDLQFKIITTDATKFLGKPESMGFGYGDGRMLISPNGVQGARNHTPARQKELKEAFKNEPVGKRSYVVQNSKTPIEYLKTAVAHEVGHFLEHALLLDIQKGVRNAGGVSADDILRLSGYATTHPVEMFAEMHAAATYQPKLLEGSMRKAYEEILKTQDPLPVEWLTRKKP